MDRIDTSARRPPHAIFSDHHDQGRPQPIGNGAQAHQSDGPLSAFQGGHGRLASESIMLSRRARSAGKAPLTTETTKAKPRPVSSADHGMEPANRPRSGEMSSILGIPILAKDKARNRRQAAEDHRFQPATSVSRPLVGIAQGLEHGEFRKPVPARTASWCCRSGTTT